MSSSFQRGLIATRSGGDIPFSPAQIPDLFCWFRGDRGADIVNGKYVSVVDGAAPEYVFAQANANWRPDASTWAGKSTPVYGSESQHSHIAHSGDISHWQELVDSDYTIIMRLRLDLPESVAGTFVNIGTSSQVLINRISANRFSFFPLGTSASFVRFSGPDVGDCVTVACKKQGSTYSMSLNGVTQSMTDSGVISLASRGLILGGTLGSSQSRSPIPEVIFYKRALDETELAQLTDYLEEEWPVTSPIFSMMGNDPDAVIEDGKFVSIPDRGSVPGAVVAQSVVGRRPEVVQWGGDGELCPRFTASNSALGSDRDANDFACLTDGKDDVLITYRYLLEETPYSPMGAFSTVPEGNTNAPGMTAHLDAVAAEGISHAEALLFSTIDGVGIRSFSNRDPVSLGTAVTMQYHVSHSAVRFFFDGNLTRTWSRTDPRYDWSAAALSLGRYRSLVFSNGLSNPIAAFRIDPGPISVEMMRSIREEIESVYPAVIPRPTIEFDPGTADITADTDGEVSQMATTGTLPVLWTNGGQPGMVWDGQTLTQSVNSQVLSIADKDVTKFLHDGSDFTMAFDTSSVLGYVFYSMSSNNQSTGITTYLQSGLPITLFGNSTIRSFTFIWSQDTHIGGLSIIRLRGKVLQAWYKGVLTQTVNLSDYAFSSEASSLQFRIAGSPVDVRWFAIWDRALDDPQVQRLIDIKNS